MSVQHLAWADIKTFRQPLSLSLFLCLSINVQFLGKEYKISAVLSTGLDSKVR